MHLTLGNWITKVTRQHRCAISPAILWVSSTWEVLIVSPGFDSEGDTTDMNKVNCLQKVSSLQASLERERRQIWDRSSQPNSFDENLIGAISCNFCLQLSRMFWELAPKHGDVGQIEIVFCQPVSRVPFFWDSKDVHDSCLFLPNESESILCWVPGLFRMPLLIKKSMLSSFEGMG